MSELILDTITGKSTATTITIGSTPVVSASANSMTIRGEGSAQTSIQQGLVKAWSHFQGSGTAASVDGFNISSIDDDGTGDYGLHYTSNMGNSTYLVTNGMDDDAVSTAVVGVDTTNGTMAAGSVDFELFYVTAGDNRTNYDYNNAYLAIIGDLA